MQAVDLRCKCGAFVIAKLPEAMAQFIAGMFQMHVSNSGDGHGPAMSLAAAVSQQMQLELPGALGQFVDDTVERMTPEQLAKWRSVSAEMKARREVKR